MFVIRYIIAVIWLLSAVSLTLAANRGQGTAYSGQNQIDKTGKNACQFNAKKLPKRWRKYYAALNEADWRKAGTRGGKSNACGKCLEVVGLDRKRGAPKKKVVVKIVDLCPKWACKAGNVDFSKDALYDITGYSWDRKTIQWKYTSCPRA